ncbi:MAG: hypothetical protein ACOZNI_22935, partial [Myxococcota bacterium]
ASGPTKEPGGIGPAVPGPALGPTIGPAPKPPGGEVDIGAWLDQNASTDKTQALQTKSGDWIDGLNAFRTNPWGGALLNLGERLIPIYGLWDGFRDSWNGMQEQWAVAPDDWFLKGLLAAQMVVSTLSAWVAHLGYLESMLGWVTAALEGLGIALNATIGEALNVITLVLDSINVYLGTIGTLYCLYQANWGSADRVDKLRYKYLAYKQLDFTVGNVVNVAFDIASIATVNFVPNAVLKGIASNAGKEFVKEAGKSAISGALGAGGKQLTSLMDLTDAEKQEITLTSDIGRLPDDIVGDVSVGLHAVGLISDQTYERLYSPAAPRNPAAPAKTAAALDRADKKAAAAPATTNPRQSVPKPDHSPAQVQALSQMEGQLTEALATTDTNVSSIDGWVAEGEQGKAAIDGALPQLDRGISTGEGIRTGLDADLPGVGSMITQGSDLAGQTGNLTQAMSGGANSAMSGMTNLGRTKVPDPPKREGLLEKVGGFLYDQTIGRAVDAARNAFAGVLSKAMEGAGPVKAGAPAGAQAQAGVQQQVGHAQETQAAGLDAQAGTAAAVAERTAQKEQGVAMRDTIDQKLEEAQASKAQQLDERAKIEALLEEVRAERARQEAANAAFKDQYGPILSGGGQEQAPAVQQAHADGIAEALGVVEALSDAAVSDVYAALGQLPAPAAAKAKAAAEEYQAQQVVLLSRLVPISSAVNGLVGRTDPAAWAALRDARAKIMTAEVQIEAQKHSVIDLFQRIAASLEEEPAKAPAQGGSATPRPSPGAKKKGAGGSGAGEMRA